MVATVDFSEIGQEERRMASQRQKRAGMSSVCRTAFRRDLGQDIDAAMQRIWDLGNSGDHFRGERDHTLATLYTAISRGLVCMTSADVIRLAQMDGKTIRRLAPKLLEGATLE